MLICNAEINNQPHQNLRIGSGLIQAIGPGLKPGPGEHTLDARGGALLPGLIDHHIHLMAYAADLTSIACGPPKVTNKNALKETLMSQPEEEWLRGTGYHESVAGPLNRTVLDELCADRPIRIQHRSGKVWYLNSAAAQLLNIDQFDEPGIERINGVATGVLFRMDSWLREQLGYKDPPDITAASALLAAQGITHITDTSPGNDNKSADFLADKQSSGALLQSVRLMGDDTLALTDNPQLQQGQLKILLDEYALPEIEALIHKVQNCHARDRGVAFHVITQTELIVALAVLDAAGSHSEDRLEHVAECDKTLIPRIRDTGVTVVTQPSFIYYRGDQYLLDVERKHWPGLYRLKSLLDAGIPVAASSDAPYGNINPWISIQTSITRQTLTGQDIGLDEAVDAAAALALYSGTAACPGQVKSITVGAAADLCLLTGPTPKDRFNDVKVNMTIKGGEVIFSAQND